MSWGFWTLGSKLINELLKYEDNGMLSEFDNFTMCFILQTCMFLRHF